MNTLLILNLFKVIGRKRGSLVSVLLTLQELGSNQNTGIPPASHFNTAVICRHHYLMKHTAVQEEQEAEFGNKGPAGNLAILSAGISLTHKLPLLLISFSSSTSSHFQKHHFNYINNREDKLKYKSCPLTHLQQVYFCKFRKQSSANNQDKIRHNPHLQLKL